MLRRRPRSTLFPYTTLCRSISTVISAINSLTLSPALAAKLLQPRGAPRDPLARGLDRSLGWLFRPFNRFFDRSEEHTSELQSPCNIVCRLLLDKLYVNLNTR